MRTEQSALQNKRETNAAIPLAGPLGFVALPPALFGFLAAATVIYLALVEQVRRRLMRSQSEAAVR